MQPRQSPHSPVSSLWRSLLTGDIVIRHILKANISEAARNAAMAPFKRAKTVRGSRRR
jgi:hypothetical protein